MRTTCRPHPLDGDVEALEHAGRQALLFAQQPEQDVLGADVVVLERPRLFLREHDDLSGPFCESLEHAVLPSCWGSHVCYPIPAAIRPGDPRVAG